MGTVVAIAVVLALGWVVVRIQDAFWKGANQHVLARAEHADGQALTRERLVIRSRVGTDALRDGVVRGLSLSSATPTSGHAELVQGPVSAGHVQFLSASRHGTIFSADARIEPTEDGGSTLTYQVGRWTSADGIVAGIPQLAFLRRRIEEIARELDPEAAVTTVPAPSERPR